MLLLQIHREDKTYIMRARNHLNRMRNCCHNVGEINKLKKKHTQKQTQMHTIMHNTPTLSCICMASITNIIFSHKET